MSLPAVGMAPEIGAIAGWRVELTTTPPGLGAGVPPAGARIFSSDSYRGSVEAALTGGLEPGSYTIVVEGVEEDVFNDLSKKAGAGAPLIANLYLRWVDTGGPIPDPAARGLVAVLRVTALRRRAGTWRYELVIEGREWVYDRLTQRLPALPVAAGSLQAAQRVAQECHIAFSPPATPGGPTASTIDQRSTRPGQRAVDSLVDLGRAMEAEAAAASTPRAGLGMYLIRDGTLHIGPGRLDRLGRPGFDPPLLAAQTGLLAIERRGYVAEDDATAVGPDDSDRPRRGRFAATLRGRPDLKPGDVVTFDPPEAGALGEELGFALGFTAAASSPGQKVVAYIQEVTHRLTREQGFLTSIQCVAAKDDASKSLPDRLWFSGNVRTGAVTTVGGEGGLVGILQKIRNAFQLQRWPDVAQVRAQHGADGDPPAQTAKLRVGTEARDGKLYAASRKQFAAGGQVSPAASYATPFAWGKFGLVLPRYPGMRVLLVHREGDADDPIDVGAIWKHGEAPAAEPGDWWLSLPAAIPATDRASVPDDREPAAPSGLASNDLIDADGGRVIAVGKLTVRIGDSALTSAGTRPTAADLPVAIEHSSGAKITIDQNGSITIEAAQTLTLSAAQGIVLDTPGDVTAQVGGVMDVRKRTA